jgi:hypothetical protein
MAILLHPAFLILFAVAGFFVFHAMAAKESGEPILRMPLTRWITIVGSVGIAAIWVISNF